VVHVSSSSFNRYQIRTNIDVAGSSPQDYLIAAIDCSISKVKSQQQGCKDPERADTCFDFPYDTCSDTSPEAALSLLHQFRLAAPSLSLAEHSTLAQPVLWHEDLHLGNIFVDPKDMISGIINWQDTHCLPLFFQVEVPSFSDFYQGSPLFDLPQNFSPCLKMAKRKNCLGDSSRQSYDSIILQASASTLKYLRFWKTYHGWVSETRRFGSWPLFYSPSGLHSPHRATSQDSTTLGRDCRVERN
jgi:hypothetical protein